MRDETLTLLYATIVALALALVIEIAVLAYLIGPT